MTTRDFSREFYQAPQVKEVGFMVPQSLLVTLSIEGEVEDFEDGGDI
ncbi:hypothetical protein [Porphyromonas sp. COT-290 OH860]|nr:hypothetical protein [Porphyromonas sp. COT-290 OH860]